MTVLRSGAWTPTEEDNCFTRLGADEIRALVEAFYDAMDDHEPALAKLHALDANGKVSRASRDRFALFLIGWLGGPPDYERIHGHPRLRMRHARFPIDDAARAAWYEHMAAAVDAMAPPPDVRQAMLDYFAMAAAHLVNQA